MSTEFERTEDETAGSGHVDHYGATYGNFASQVYGEIRAETYGEDIGQTSWLTAQEQDSFIGQLGLTSESHVLDVGSGPGGPSIRLARVTGCSVAGVDIHEAGIENARRLAEEAGLSHRVQFTHHDASKPLPFEDGTFDAVICIDAINHLPDRERTLTEWARVLRRGGRVLFTDPIVITGPLTDEEIAVRSSIGFYIFMPPGINEKILKTTGYDVMHREDRTENMAAMARQWGAAREARSERLEPIEGEETYRGQQRFFAVSTRIAEERRLSRFVYVAEKVRTHPESPAA